MAIKIPRYDSPTVEPGAMPTPHMTGATPDAFGAGLARGLNQAANQFEELARKEQAKANTAAVLNARMKLNQFEQDAFYGDVAKPGMGILKKRGLAAAQDETNVISGYKKFVDETENSLSNDDQKTAFRSMASERFMSMQENLARHTRKEMDWHNDQTLKATEQSSMDRIGMHYSDPKEVQREIEIINFARSKRLDDEGVGHDPESATIRANYLKDGESKAHGLVISKLVESDDFPTAKKYFEDHKEVFQADDLIKIEHTINQEEKAYQREQERQRKEQAEAAEAAVLQTITQIELSGGTPRLRDLPKDQFEKLMQLDPKAADNILDEMRRERERAEDRAERDADRAERRADRAERRSEKENGINLMTWSHLVQNPELLKRENLDKLYLRGAISKQGYADLSRRRSEIINNPAKEQAIRGKSDAVNGIFKASGLKAGTAEHNRAWQVVENIMRTKEKPTYDETLNAARLAVTEVPRPGRNKPLFKMGVSDVPAEEQAKIRADFNTRLRRDPTEGEITYYYGMKQLKGK